MGKSQFFVRLVPPRATFIQDMTADERAQMKAHAEYTRLVFEAGAIVVYGPVLDPKQGFGMAVFEAADEATVRAILDEDPSVKSGLNRYEIARMVVAGARAT